jgi:hypothetical protein
MSAPSQQTMWHHYCQEERCTLDLLVGEQCNWCNSSSQIMLPTDVPAVDLGRAAQTAAARH